MRMEFDGPWIPSGATTCQCGNESGKDGSLAQRRQCAECFGEQDRATPQTTDGFAEDWRGFGMYVSRELAEIVLRPSEKLVIACVKAG